MEEFEGGEGGKYDQIILYEILNKTHMHSYGCFIEVKVKPSFGIRLEQRLYSLRL